MYYPLHRLPTDRVVLWSDHSQFGQARKNAGAVPMFAGAGATTGQATSCPLTVWATGVTGLVSLGATRPWSLSRWSLRCLTGTGELRIVNRSTAALLEWVTLVDLIPLFIYFLTNGFR